jgi:hypothetical protein
MEGLRRRRHLLEVMEGHPHLLPHPVESEEFHLHHRLLEDWEEHHLLHLPLDFEVELRLLLLLPEGMECLHHRLLLEGTEE